MTWDEYYLHIAAAVALKSKDPSTQVGAVIVSPDNTIIATGYNGFPKGVSDTPDRLGDRTIKYKLVSHAERNAIFFAARCGVRLAGSTLYVRPLPVCPECAIAIAQAGIARVVALIEQTREHWEEEARWSKLIFREAGIHYEPRVLLQNDTNIGRDET